MQLACKPPPSKQHGKTSPWPSLLEERREALQVLAESEVCNARLTSWPEPWLSVRSASCVAPASKQRRGGVS